MRRLGLALAMTLLAAPAWADNETRIIQLKHRTADEIIPIVRPLLGPHDALSGTDYRLILRTSDKNLKEIERVLAQLDVAPRQWRITVQQATEAERARATQSLSGETEIGDRVRITLPKEKTDDHGLTVQKGDLQYRTARRATTSQDRNTQTVMTLDGKRAYIRIGQSVPHVKKILALARDRIVIAQGVELQNVVTGFEVLPRAHGARVRLEITPRLSTPEDPATGLATFQEMATTIEAKPGEWIDLGAILESRGEIGHALLESASAESGERRTILLKAE